MIAAMIEGTDMLRKDPEGLNSAGLCTVVMRLYKAGVLSNTVATRMMTRAMKAALLKTNRKKVYLTKPCNWTNGVRLEYALKFAKECAPRSKR